jgi:two-component system, cell cycle response regulator CtrA
MNILIVEDDAGVAGVVECAMRMNGVESTVVGCGAQALEALAQARFDIIFLDMLLPDYSGFELIADIRGRGISTPILVMSGLGEIEHKVRALKAGADEYIEKPFDQEEFIARFRAVARRERRADDEVIAIGDIAINLDRKSVVAAGVELDLTRKEYQILEALFLKKGSPVSKEMLLSCLYRQADEPVSKIIDVYVCNLRKKISDVTQGKSYIFTAKGEGYFIGEAQQAAVRYA